MYSGRTVDAFRLRGAGPIQLVNGFVAQYTETRVPNGWFSIDPISSYGDPFGFPSGPSHCDPI